MTATYKDGSVHKIDTAKIERLLLRGTKEECCKTLFSFFDEIGYRSLNSLMLRLYITMDIYITAGAFAAEIGVPADRFETRFGSIDNIERRMSDITSTLSYFTDMLEQCVEWRIERTERTSGDVIGRAKAYIAENFTYENTSLRTVAEAVSLSPTYFSTLFKKETGVSFVNYLTDIRLERAKELLSGPPMPISRIAYEVGFRDYRYFGQIFRRHTGKTPREYQNKYGTARENAVQNDNNINKEQDNDNSTINTAG